MGIRVRAHFDGKVIVPEEPVDLPAGQQVQVELHIGQPFEEQDDFARRLAAMHRIAARGVRGTSIPLEALRRENLYEDRL